jgi:hypothetical protein
LKPVHLKPNPTLTALCSSVALLAACGGGSSSPPAPTVLTGVAAKGAPLAGASMVVIDSDTTTTDPAAVTAGADGSYSVDVSALKAPFVVQATATVEGVVTKTVAVVPSVTANASNTANVTPLTNAVAALIAPGGDPLALLVPATLSASATSQKVSDASALLVNTLNTDAATAAALGANFNPLTTVFSANGTGVDAVLDKLAIDVSATGVAITNLAAPLPASGVPAPVTLTPAQAATPTVVPTLPTSAPAGNVPTAAELAALGAKYEACLALPVAQRVTQDAAGIVTAVSPTCNFAAADWKSNGRTWVQELGQFTFSRNTLTGAKVGKGLVVLTLAGENLTDPKEFKHPYCNTGPCVVVRYPLTTASAQATAGDWLLGKVNGAWDFVGNHRPYRAFAEPRLNRKIATNPAGAAVGNTADPYFFKDRFESQMRLVFDLNSPNTNDVRAVRFTGPGLPTAGVVLSRSQRCGTDDRMGITYQNGSTRLNTDNVTFQFWTGSGAADFILDAANLDGTALAMPTPVLNTTTASFQDFSPTAVANQATSIPAWSRYKIELFRYSALSDSPDEILYTRINSGAENAGLGAAKQWPTLAQGFIDSYLKPTGASAGEVASIAQTLSWTTPAGNYVGSGYLFSQNFASVTNSQAETASYGLRTRLDFEPLALGDLSAPGREFAKVVAGTSLSTYTANLGTNPNPRCTSTNVVPLTTNISDYREAGLSYRGTDRKLYNAIWFWDN